MMVEELIKLLSEKHIPKKAEIIMIGYSPKCNWSRVSTISSNFNKNICFLRGEKIE